MSSKLVRTIQRKFFPSEFDKELTKWFGADGDFNKRLDYDLSENSFAIDLGGYKGQFASDLFAKYLCGVWVFEPIAEYFEVIEKRFEKNPRIQSFKFALGNEDKEEVFYLDNDGTSIHNKSSKDSSHSQTVIFRNIEAFFSEHSIDVIDLIKINIEGGEYDLLDYLIEKNLIAKFANIQVQFHKFVPGSEERMHAIQLKLKETHELKWQYRFVWESWAKKQ